jgi:hypothetical protein
MLLFGWTYNTCARRHRSRRQLTLMGFFPRESPVALFAMGAPRPSRRLRRSAARRAQKFGKLPASRITRKCQFGAVTR